MEINLTGLAAALATFLGIWWGHVAVRVLEARLADIRSAMIIAVLLGMGMWTGALLTDWMPLSAALGIFGVTLLWDGCEFYRQEKRVKIGHAPANPANPRHARILAAYPSATTLDLLGRDPVGRTVDSEKAARLVAER
jgi:uncharacterized membrane protein YfcA